jgi:3-oxoadipate enol-lactonase
MRLGGDVNGILESGPGRSLYYSEKGSGPTLLCLHGLGGGSYFFAGLADALQDAFRVVAIDLPGCGLSSSAPSGFSFENCVEVAQDLIRERLGGGITVLGHSMGTIIGLKLAIAESVSVSRLIFVGGLPQPLPEARIRLQKRAREARERGMLEVADATMPVVFSPAALRAMPDKVALYRRLLELHDPLTYAQAAEALLCANAWDSVARVRVPCLAITGADDRYAPPPAVKEFVRHLPGPFQYHEIEECGHMPFFEKPDVFQKVVRHFLDGSSPS